MELRFFLYLLILFTISIIGLRKFNYRTSRFRYLTILVFLIFIFESASRLIAYNIGNNMPLYHVTILFQCLLYALIYQRNYSLVVRYLYISVAIISVVSSIFLQSIWTFPSIPVALLSLVVVISVLLDLKFMLNSPITKPLLTTPDFWMNLGGLFFFTFTFFAFGLMNIAQWVFPD